MVLAQAFAEAEVYKKQKEAEGNKNRLTPNYLRQSHLRHLAARPPPRAHGALLAPPFWCVFFHIVSA